MKKKRNQGDFGVWADFPKIYRIMRLMCLFMIMALVQVSASTYSQNTKLSLSGQKLTIEQVLSRIEDQTDFSFFYNSKEVDLSKVVNVAVKDQSIEEVLDFLMEGTGMTYTISNKLIVIHKSKDAGFAGINSQQTKTVTGKVTDSSGSPLPGVTVLVKGTTQGIITDADGNYSLAKVSEDAVLVFSFVGMKSQEIEVSGKTTADVVMEEDAIGIEEIVAIGYGSVKKSTVTGAISSVQMETIQPLATQRVDQMLQGQAAGVMVLNTDGAPGGNTTIRIRGMNSIQGGNNALIVIDGFQGGDLNALNPNDIASVEILKDASATAIYGSQGANGVVLIETKKGKTDKPVINFSTEFGTSNLMMGGIELMNAVEYAREMNSVEMADNYDRTPIPIFTDAEIAELEKTGGTDWLDEIFNTALTQTYQLSLSGKTKNVNYFLSGSFLNQDGILKESDYKRYTLRANVSADINNWLSCGINWQGTQQDKSGVEFGSGINYSANPIAGAMLFSPAIQVYDDLGNYSEGDDRYGATVWNPVASVMEPEVENKNTQNIVNLFVEFKLLKGLTLKLSGGANINNRTYTEFYNDKTQEGEEANGGRATATNTVGRSYQNSNILTYTNDFGKHHINATAVGEIKYASKYEFSANGSAFTIQKTGINNLEGTDIQTISSLCYDRKMNSALTRINYGYDDKYLISFSYRADGSSVFGENSKWGYFPSASLGWRLSKENFMKNIEPVSNLMLRFSWGKTGNQAIDAYETLAKVSSSGTYPWDGGESSNVAFEISAASNPDLKWETTRQTNIGLDLSLLNNRLRMSAEYYDKVTEDLLMEREIPLSSGLSSIIDNVGSIGNNGWEFSINGDFQFGSLYWKMGVNYSFSETKVLDLGDDEYIAYKAGGSGHGANIPFMYLTEGESFGQIMGFGYEGTWNTGEEEEAGKYGQMVGDSKYTDVNDDGIINYDHDWKVIGNTLPDFIFGITNQFNYKKWELSFLIQGTFGNDIFNVARIKRERVGEGYSKDFLNRWTEDNQDTDIPGLIDQQTREDYKLAWNEAHPDAPFVSTVSFPADGGNVCERWVEDASYIRMKNITLSYTFPKSRYFNNLRLYVGATNLFTITKYKGFDPEVSSFTDNDAQMGTDFNNYPQSRTYTVGINVTF